MTLSCGIILCRNYITTPSGLRSRVCCCCCYIYRSSLHLVKVLGACTERTRQLSSETIDNSAGISFFASSISLSIPHYHRSIPPLQCMARAAPTDRLPHLCHPWVCGSFALWFIIWSTNYYGLDDGRFGWLELQRCNHFLLAACCWIYRARPHTTSSSSSCEAEVEGCFTEVKETRAGPPIEPENERKKEWGGES
jgi:hypothetical protein